MLAMARHWETLFARWLSSAGEERESCGRRLRDLDDPRMVPRLQALLLDVGAPHDVRMAASDVLLDLANAPDSSDAQVRAWWSSGDAPLQRHALLCATEGQQDIVASVLADDEHPRHGDAVAALAFDFPEPWATERLVSALGHPAAEVRRTAASTLLWNEPVRALEPLLRAARDADASVASAALDTLCYYRAARALLPVVHGLLAHPDVEVQSSASNCLDHLRDDVLSELREPKREPRLRAWLAPVWSELGLSDAAIEASREPTERVVSAAHSREPWNPPWLESPRALAVHVEALDLPEADRHAELVGANWDAVDEKRRAGFAEVLMASDDVVVRQRACDVVSRWGDHARIRRLLDDPFAAVRQSAAYHARKLALDPELAERLWAMTQQTRRIAATEALESAVALGEPTVWRPRVNALLADRDAPEALRFAAVYALLHARDADAITGHLPLLLEAPRVTWAIHLALLEAARQLSLELPDISILSDVDDLHVQVALSDVDIT
jgi:hypothetical protein